QEHSPKHEAEPYTAPAGQKQRPEPRAASENVTAPGQGQTQEPLADPHPPAVAYDLIQLLALDARRHTIAQHIEMNALRAMVGVFGPDPAASAKRSPASQTAPCGRRSRGDAEAR